MRRLLFLMLLPMLSACGNMDRLAEVGRAPAMTEIGDLRGGIDRTRIAYPTKVEPFEGASPSSLWRPGSKTFLKDQRAARVGDIVTVKIAIDDNANLDNQTNRSRSSDDSLNLGSLFGYSSKIAGALPGHPALNAAEALGSNGKANFAGKGGSKRSEKVTLQVAAVVIGETPNGNFVINGRQELRVNNELRQVQIAGIVRPQDIDNKNSISSENIAEARISYGGRGIISDVQQPSYGQQIIDMISPF